MQPALPTALPFSLFASCYPHFHIQAWMQVLHSLHRRLQLCKVVDPFDEKEASSARFLNIQNYGHEVFGVGKIVARCSGCLARMEAGWP
jgi:hypothetical protein